MPAWNWDQGRLAYFQFDALREIARLAITNDFTTATRERLLEETGLSFQAPPTHSPWRNYSRVLKLCLLVNLVNGRAEATPVAHVLSQPGLVTCDEYLHFLVCASTSPSPALQGWSHNAAFRYPLLFSLKYLLTKSAIDEDPSASIDEIIGAYEISGLTGDEDDNAFIAVVRSEENYERAGRRVPADSRRQAAESLRVIAQISYLHIRRREIQVSLDQRDAQAIFEDLAPVGGPRQHNREAEIRRLADLFEDGSTSIVSITHTRASVLLSRADSERAIGSRRRISLSSGMRASGASFSACGPRQFATFVRSILRGHIRGRSVYSTFTISCRFLREHESRRMEPPSTISFRYARIAIAQSIAFTTDGWTRMDGAIS